LNKFEILLFIWARPTFSFLGRPTRVNARLTLAVASPPPTPADRPVPPVKAPLLSPSPTARRTPLISDTAARHYCHGPPVSLSPPPLFGRQCAHGARRPRPSVSRRCRPGAVLRSAGSPPARAPLPPRVGPVSRPPSPPASPAPSQKGVGRCCRTSARFSLLRPHSEHPTAKPIAVCPSRPRSAVSLARISAAASPSFTRSVSRQPSRFPVNLDPTAPHSLPPRGAELGPCCRRPPCPLHCRRSPLRRATPLPPQRTVDWVSLTTDLLAWRHPGTPSVLAGNTLPSASPHHAAVERVTAPARERAARGDRTVSAHDARPVSVCRGRLLGWVGPPGRGPVGFSAGRAWQAVGSSTPGRGRMRSPSLCDGFYRFSIF
jgi:hypothetical protein